MSDDAIEVENVASQFLTGQCTVVAALVIALHENGVLPQGNYSAILQRLWSRMPEEQAVGKAGAIIEQMLDLLSARAFAAFPPGGAEPKPEISVPPRTALSCAIVRQGDIAAALGS